jgi:ABC-type Na+ efflux pump permease subunit
MLVDAKDVITVLASTATSLLGVVLAILAVMPFAFELVSTRVTGFFRTNYEVHRLTTAFIVIIAIAVILIATLLLLLLSIIFPTLQTAVSVVSVILLMISLLGFLSVIALAASILNSVRKER